ncbi:MAG: DUF167 family protein [Candidatus Aenigmatarchaeota archaeon]
MAITQAKNGVIIEARVKAASGGFSVTLEKDGITICTKSNPEGGKANQEIVKNLVRIFRRDVRIIRGLKDRRKEILIEGASPLEVEVLLKGRK